MKMYPKITLNRLRKGFQRCNSQTSFRNNIFPPHLIVFLHIFFMPLKYFLCIDTLFSRKPPAATHYYISGKTGKLHDGCLTKALFIDCEQLFIAYE